MITGFSSGANLEMASNWKLKITIRPAFIGAKDQHLCAHLQSDSKPSNHIKGWRWQSGFIISDRLLNTNAVKGNTVTYQEIVRYVLS